MWRRIVQIFLILPLALALIVFSVANRHRVTLSLDPFDTVDPALALSVPLFLLVFLILAIGVVVGGVAVWLGQAKWRRRARLEHEEAARWRYRAGEAVRAAAEPEARGRSLVPVTRR